MAYVLDLEGCWAKLKRAELHIESLKYAVAGRAAHTKPLTLRQQYEAEHGAIIFRVKHIDKLPIEWSLIVGDAAHNLRCALDHLAWQLALRYFNGVEPTDRKIIKQIQFPVVTDVRIWPNHPNRKFMSVADADKLEKVQPFKMPRRNYWNPNLLELLAGFGGLDNIDKHREIHVAIIAPEVITFMGTVTGNRPLTFTDCDCVRDEQGMPKMIATIPSSLKPQDEVLRIFVTATGPKPQVDLEPHIACFVAIRGHLDATQALERLAQGVASTVREFE